MRFSIKQVVLSIVSFVLISSVGCQTSDINQESTKPMLTATESKDLIIYSGRKENLIKPVIDKFQKETGIKVSINSGGASELANVLMEEKSKTKADIFIANDAGTLEKLKQNGIFESYNSEKVSMVPDDIKASDGSWIGISSRARVIMYNKTMLTEKDLPTSVLDLTKPKWKGQVAMASTSNESVIGHISGMRIAIGDKATETFLQNLKNNDVKILKGHTEVRQAVASGEFKLGVVNHYYYHLQLKEGSNVGVIYPDQGPDQFGTMVNISGVGIIKGSKHKDAAQKFVDFLLRNDVQYMFANANFEIPVFSDIKVQGVKGLQEFKRMNISLEQLGKELNPTIDMIEKVNFK